MAWTIALGIGFPATQSKAMPRMRVLGIESPV